MSDYSISIIPKQSTFPERQSKAKEILEWLISLDIIKSKLSDCIPRSNYGYEISNGAKLVCNEPAALPFHFATNGLEIITERQVFDTGEIGIEELICPNCKQDISSEDWDFLSGWIDNLTNNLTCPLCNIGTAIHQFKFMPEWGVSDLGFTFWN